MNDSLRLPTHKRLSRLYALVATASMALSACGNDDPLLKSDAKIESLRVSTTSGFTTLSAGLSEQLIATAIHEDGVESDVTSGATWVSLDPSVATVDAAGMATSLKSGSAVISAGFREWGGDVTLMISPAILASVEITPSSASLAKGEQSQLIATAKMTDGVSTDVTGNASWQSSDSSILTVGGGNVTAITPGMSIITAKYEGFEGSANVTVNPPSLLSITLSTSSFVLRVGGERSVRATGNYSDETSEDISMNVSWTSAKESVVTISDQGLVTAVAPGETTISAQLNTVSASANVTVAAAGAVPVLGNGSHSINDVTLSVISSSGHAKPVSLSFHPDKPNELWVLSQDDHAMWIATDPGLATQTSIRRVNRYGDHFMPHPSAFAFGGPGCTSTVENQPSSPDDPNSNRCLATSHDQDEPTPHTGGQPGTFMGPSLWTGDRDAFQGGHSDHFDMLHNSPQAMGIAWEKDQVYWIFDGHNSSLTRYDFVNDHGPGGSSHSDGVVARYAQGFVQAESGVPSHMDFDQSSKLLYIADTGNQRIAVLDTMSGTRGGNYGPNYDGTTQYRMDAVQLSTLIDGSAIGMNKPSGLVLHDDLVFVSDYETGKIFAFDFAGALVDWLDTGLGTGALAGMTFDENGSLFLVDASQDRVLKITP